MDPGETRQLISDTFGRIPASLQEPALEAGGGPLDSTLLSSVSEVDLTYTNGAAAAAAAAAATPADAAAAGSIEAVSHAGAGGAHQPGGAAAASVAAAAAAAGAPASGAMLDGLPSQSRQHLVRPPVEHQWGCAAQLLHGAPPARVSVFRHRLLQLFQLSVFCKLPVRPMTTMEDIRRGQRLVSCMQPAEQALLRKGSTTWRAPVCGRQSSPLFLSTPLPACPACPPSLLTPANLCTPPSFLPCRRAFMVRILLSVLQFRINARYVEANPPFVGIELDHSDSGEGGLLLPGQGAPWWLAGWGLAGWVDRGGCRR